MFTGIIEGIGKIVDIEKVASNITYTLSCNFANELKIDQSLAHNGVCLTVIDCDNEKYKVTAINETLKRTNLVSWQIGSIVNLERCTKVGDRLDGHIVQGHVDQTATCTSVRDLNGSWEFRFKYENSQFITVEKGSICINGVSLTVVDSLENEFSVHIIPYTYENTNFKDLKIGDLVNLEFDIVGKYISKLVKK